MEFPNLLAVEVVAPYALQLQYADGVRGQVDFSELKEKGVFKWWKKKGNFEQVFLDKEKHVIKWSGSIEMDADALYLKVKGLTFEQWKSLNTHASVS